MNTDHRKAVVRRYIAEIWNQGHVDLVDRLMTPDYQNHDPSTPGRVLHGRDAFKAFVLGMRAAIAELEMAVQEQWAEGDVVVTRWVASGVHKGPLGGIPATGRPGKGIDGITITRFSGDFIAQDTAVWDTLGLLRQLGVVPGA